MKGKKIFYFLMLILMTLSIINISCKKETGETVQPDVKPLRAVIQMSMGKVLATKGANTTEIKRGMDITDSDYIQTFAGSRCVILFTTGSSLSLQENTKISVRVLMPKGIKAEMAQGSVLMNVKRLTSDDSFSVSTPTAVAGVRGTKFLVSYDSKTASTRVAVGTGKVSVSPRVTVQVQEQTRTRIQESIAVEVTDNQSVSLNQNQTEQINKVINKDVQAIENNVQGNKDISSLNSVQSARQIIINQKGVASVNDVNKLKQITEDNQETQTPTEPIKRKVLKRVELPRIAAKLNIGNQAISPLFAADSKVMFVAKNGNFIIADMSTNGRIIATVPINSEIDSTPVLYQGIVYFGAKNSVLYAINARNGAVVFNKPLEGPLAFKNSVFGHQNFIYVATGGAVVYKLNRLNGQEIWKTNVGENVWACVAVDNDKLYVADESGVLRALKTSDGSAVWKQKAGLRVSMGSVFVRGKRVFINTEAGELKVFNTETGDPVPSNIQVGRLVNAPYLHGTFGYYPRGNNILVVSLDALRVVGTINTSGASYFGVQGNNVYASVSGNELKEMDLIGRPTWGIELDAKITHNPAADDLYVYALTESGTLYKLNKRDHMMVLVEVQE